MLTLLAADTIRAVAGAATSITYTISGLDNALPKITQGQVSNVAGTIYTASGSGGHVASLMFANTTAGAVSLTIYVNGTAAANQIGSFSIPANGEATYTTAGWRIHDSTGALLSTAPLTLTGDVTGSGSGSIATTLATVNANIGSFGTNARIPAVTVNAKGLVTAASDTPVLTSPASQTPVGVTRSIATTAPLTGGGDLSADRTLALTTSPAGQTPVGTTRTITTTAPLTIDAGASADLSANRTLAVSDATTTTRGTLTATEKIELNALDGRNSAGAVKRVFRPGDYMVGNTYDPTGAADSTSSFAAMMTAVNALNDRCVIELAPGVFQVAQGTFTGFGTAPIKIRGAGRGVTVIIPTTNTGNCITLGAGADGVALEGFAIYQTGTPHTAGAGIETNAANSVTIENMLFVNQFIDVRVSGRQFVATTNGTINVTSVSPALTAGLVGQPVSGPGIVPGTTLATQAGTSGTLSIAATNSVSGNPIVIGNSIKVSIERTLHSQSSGSATSVGILVNNGQAGDTYIGPDVVMSNAGSPRRRASVELIESGHYEIIQCNLTGAAQGILIDPGTAQSVAFGFHTNVLCDSCTVNGMTLSAATATSTIKNIKSANSWYSGTTAAAGLSGVVTSGTAGGIINGITHSMDRFLNNQRHGYEHGFGTDFRWDSCDMKGNNAVNAAIGTGYDGLNVAAGLSNFSVNGGKYGGTDTAVTSPNQRYGINVLAGAGDNIKIGPDDLSGNRDGPLQFGATGRNTFVNGCPGLPQSYVRGASSGAISTTQITLGQILVPKNSLRVGSTFRLTCNYQHAGAATVPTFQIRYGATNDAVGSNASNAVVVAVVAPTGAANAWGTIALLATITAIGAAGNLQGSGSGVQAAAAFATATLARASGAGFLAVDTTVDRYMSISGGVAATSTFIAYNTTIEVVNY